MPAIAYNAKNFEKPELLIEAQNWLIAFKGSYCAEIDKVRAMVPAHQWEHYKNLGITGLWETDELKRVLKILRERWTERPDILKKSKIKTLFAKNKDAKSTRKHKSSSPRPS